MPLSLTHDSAYNILSKGYIGTFPMVFNGITTNV